MLSLYFFITQVVTPRYTALLDHWDYGEGKVFHMRASVYQDKQSDIYAFSVQGQTDIVIVTNGKIQAYQVALEADVVLISVSEVAEKTISSCPIEKRECPFHCTTMEAASRPLHHQRKDSIMRFGLEYKTPDSPVVGIMFFSVESAVEARRFADELVLVHGFAQVTDPKSLHNGAVIEELKRLFPGYFPGEK